MGDNASSFKVVIKIYIRYTHFLLVSKIVRFWNYNGHRSQ